ncbi:MAG: RnfABCDGE type electron transport complex subunit [Bacillota bacterium]|jgi:electron transport complex protein RnfG|nr:RnfABCDGE type electron transport complex subunit [Bacillota bacterium]MDF2948251.1 RnfABCDGE type electron transport complex subunit [Sedimentibacter sp.]
MKNNFVRLAGVLFIISAISAGSLAWLNDFTKDRIEQNDLSASMSPEVIQAVAPGANTFVPFDDAALVESIKAENAKFVDLLTIVDGSGNAMGTVVQTLTPTPGYGGDMELYVGIDKDGKFTGMSVIAHSETSGLGTRTTEPDFWSQFVGKDASAEVASYDAISGVTKSSVSFVSAVNNAVSIYSQYLK